MSFEVSLNFCRGRENMLAGTEQENAVSGNICRDTSYLILKVIEKERKGIMIKGPILIETMQ